MWTGSVSPPPPECVGNFTLGSSFAKAKVAVPLDLRGRRIVDGHRGQFLGPDGPQYDQPPPGWKPPSGASDVGVRVVSDVERR